MMRSSANSTRFLSRQRLLDVVRGITQTGTDNDPKKLCYKCFPLEAHHIGSLNNTDKSQDAPSPQDFHAALCHRIRNARDRVYLASLYVGPAVDPQKYHKEAELLEALRWAASTKKKTNKKNTNSNNPAASGTTAQPLDIKILLDLNRALRPVPLSSEKDAPTITSAEACRRALATSHHETSPSSSSSSSSSSLPPTNQIFLLSALKDFWQHILPNPLNEAMGVFHIKAYVIDDTLILSGANLSEEYFSDRHDRYLSIHQGGNGLVDCYADLVNALCHHAQVYSKEGDTENSKSTYAQREQLLESVSRVIMTAPEQEQQSNLDKEDSSKSSKIVAVAVPTFQAPPRFGRIDNLRYDVDATHDLMRELARITPKHATNALRMTSAYLNPTTSFLKACQPLTQVQFLTAGRISHGFKPKNKAGNKGKDWIPTVFDEISRSLISRGLSVWFYQRPNWTFHAKGLWFSIMGKDNTDNSDKDNEDSNNVPHPTFGKDEELLAVTHGSGNFGARSELRDWESNCFLFFPPGSPLAQAHKVEWNEMAEYAAHSTDEEEKKLSAPYKWVLPSVRSFF